MRIVCFTVCPYFLQPTSTQQALSEARRGFDHTDLAVNTNTHSGMLANNISVMPCHFLFTAYGWKSCASLRQSRHAQNRASAWQNLFYNVCLKDYNNGLTLTLPWEQQLLICALQFTSFFWNSQPHFMVFILIVNFIVHSFSFSNDLDMEYHSRDNIQLHT